MRRSLEEASDSDNSNDEEIDFKRRRYTKAMLEKKIRQDTDDHVDSNSGSRNGAWAAFASRAVAEFKERGTGSTSTAPPLTRTVHFTNNGVKAIPCSVITKTSPGEVKNDSRLPPPSSPVSIQNKLPGASSTSAMGMRMRNKSPPLSPTIPIPIPTKSPPSSMITIQKKLPPPPRLPSQLKGVPSTSNGVANGRGGEVIHLPGGITFLSSSTKIMKEMGFDPSRGLGKIMNSCEVDASTIEEVEKRLDEAGMTVDDESLDLAEIISLEEEVQWIKPIFPLHLTDYGTLSQWKKDGEQKSTISEETAYIDPQALNDLLALKRCLSGMYSHEYMQIRSRSNPFESLGKGPFLCRAALKMANLDASLSFALTQPTTSTGEKVSAVGPNDLFYFADVCAGPGGFSEYILSKKKWECKGFGLTLKGDLDFDLWSSTVADPENFEAFYGPATDGDIYNPRNTTAFINYIRSATDGRGVHLMMADGGFDVDNKEMQEIVSARIYLSQCYVALSAVRTGGMFVCKLFDTLTPFTIGLIYLMYISFDLVALHKPKTSRPANSERYLICKWKRLDTDGICSYLASCYAWYWESQSRDPQSKECILELVPSEILESNTDFIEYIRQSNTRIARHQIENLKKMIIFLRDPNLRDTRQEKIKAKLFDMWKIPQSSTSTLISTMPKSPDSTFKEILGATNPEFLQCSEYSLLEHNVEAFLRSPFDWRIVVVGGTQNEYNRGLYMSLGRDKIYRYQNKLWTRISERLELTKDTLVYGEFVDEVHGKKPSQRVVKTFHIIDGMCLGGMDIRIRHYTARLELCIKFAKSMNKPTNKDLCWVRAKIPVRMENIADVFDRLENRVVSGAGAGSHLVCPVDHTDETLPFIRPSGILFLKITKDPWTMALSRSSNRKYYFNIQTGTSSYDLVMESISEFDYTMQHRMLWWWDKELQTVLSTQNVTDTTKQIVTGEGVLNPQKLLQYINAAWQANRTAVMRRLSSSSSSQGST